MLITDDLNLLDNLNRIKAGTYNPDLGVCGNLDLCVSATIFTHILAGHWPKFSGSFVYPIPAPEGFKPEDQSASPRFYCVDAYDDLDKWDAESPYGALRWEAIDFVINFLNQKENEHDESNRTPDAGTA